MINNIGKPLQLKITLVKNKDAIGVKLEGNDMFLLIYDKENPLFKLGEEIKDENEEKKFEIIGSIKEEK